MNKAGQYLVLVTILTFSAFIAAGCAPATGLASTGAIEVHVTDPGHSNNISSIDITASVIEIHKAGDGGEEGEWIALNITMPVFDLIELKEGGLEETLAAGNVTAGKYTQIRMTIEAVEVILDGQSQDATVPSGKLKFVRPFEVMEGRTTVLTLDFDAGKSVTITGAGKVILRPVVTLNVTMPSD